MAGATTENARECMLNYLKRLFAHYGLLWVLGLWSEIGLPPPGTANQRLPAGPATAHPCITTEYRKHPLAHCEQPTGNQKAKTPFNRLRTSPKYLQCNMYSVIY